MTNVVSLLLVEDEPVLAMALEATLIDAGFDVVVAATGDEALTLIDERIGDIAALVTDIRLPGPNGWELARHARALRADVAVVYMSGDSAADWSAEGVPMSVMLLKPFADAQLVTAISNLLNQAG